MRWLEWARQRDRNLAALRRAARAAIVMPSLFAIGVEAIDNLDVALFAGFGAFAMLLLADFTGPMPARLQAQAALVVAGVVIVCLGTLASAHAWLAAVGMLCIGFVILFAGVVSSVLAGAAPALLLSYILPVCLPAPASAIPERVAGWGLAGVVSMLAIAILWPTPTSDPLRQPAAAAMASMADRLRTDVAFVRGGADAPTFDERERAVEESDAAVALLRQRFLASPYRPTGLSTSDRTTVRLVDELEWLAQIVRYGRPTMTVPHYVSPHVIAVKCSAADVLERGSDVLLDPAAGSRELESAMDALSAAVGQLDEHVAAALPERRLGESESGDHGPDKTLTALDPTFRAQELAFGTTQIAANVVLTAAAEQRGWVDRVLGRQPHGVPTRWAAAAERGSAHLRLSSVWLQNSVRGAIGLAVAVFIADSAGLQHAFWIVLGTLSVLRSNALSTGQNVLRGLLGTVAGFVIGGALMAAIGAERPVLWVLFPVAVLVAGFLPAAISFAAGQAAFTVVVMILFNIMAPAGWEIGLVRIEDVALGCGVSLLVGLLFWPRGAGAELRRSIAVAYGESIRYVASAVAFGMARHPSREPGSADVRSATDGGLAAAASSRRLDDAYRTYLAERGAKPSSLANVTGLVNGVVGVRLAGDAVVDLWRRDDSIVVGEHGAAQREIIGASDRLVAWYEALSRSLVGPEDLPEPLEYADIPDGELIRALRDDLADADESAVTVAARLIWTRDYLDALRRHQTTLVGPAREARRIAMERATGPLAWLR